MTYLTDKETNKELVKMNKTKVKAKDEFYPLYRKGDDFIILDRTNDERVLPIKALRLKDKQIYYFEEGELL